MPHYTDYKCTQCLRPTLKELLVVKKVVFQPLGAKAKTLKSRTVGWQCDECVEIDPEYQLEAFNGPGHKSEALERVRAIQSGKE